MGGWALVRQAVLWMMRGEQLQQGQGRKITIGEQEGGWVGMSKAGRTAGGNAGRQVGRH